MSKHNLSSVTAAVIDSYGNTAINVIHAYRAGSERVIGFVDQRFEAVVNTDAVNLAEQVRTSLIDTQQRISGYTTKRLHHGTERAENAIHTAVDLAHKGARRIAANAERFDQATQLGALEAINRVALPAATAMSQVISRIEDGSSRLVRRVAGKSTLVKAAARKAKTVNKAAAKAASTAAHKTEAAKKTAVRKTSAAVRKARAAVADAAA
jgi:hypothetical protein